MHDWEQMASFVARKLVENGQTRILQRIYEGMTSDWILDVADGKSSMEHQLIHLVWRKFPRNQHSMEDLHPTVSTQTEEASSSSLGLAAGADLTGLMPKLTISDSTQTTEDIRPGPKHISRNYVASVSDCLSQSDLREFFDANESSSNSDADLTSDFSVSSTDLTQNFGISFTKPARRRSGKPLSPEKKFQPQLSNRFDCLKELKSPVNLYENSDLSDRKSIICSRGNRSRSPPKLVNESKIPETSKTSIVKSCETPSTSKINSEMTQSMKEDTPCCSMDAEGNRREKGTVIFIMQDDPLDTLVQIRPDISRSNSGNSGTLFLKFNIHSAKDFGIKEGDRVSYILLRGSLGDHKTYLAKDIWVIDNG